MFTIWYIYLKQSLLLYLVFVYYLTLPLGAGDCLGGTLGMIWALSLTYFGLSGTNVVC